tara:strand:- start:94 stop:255 length:162 start_codon:yes stop_codon:yes gene_type:complete
VVPGDFSERPTQPPTHLQRLVIRTEWTIGDALATNGLLFVAIQRMNNTWTAIG